MLNLVLALLAGVVTVAAPCTLPMLPILLGASVGQTGKVRPAMIALGFVMSFSMVALLLGAITRVFDFDPNHAAKRRSDPAARLWIADDLAGAIRMALGPDRRLSSGHSAASQPGRDRRLRSAARRSAWSGRPAPGPVLGSILTVIATSKDTAWASLLLVVYAIGAALPMLAIAYGGQAVTDACPQRRAHRAAAAAGLWRRRDRLRALFPTSSTTR